ncbi:SAF domain-containing protein [Sulfurimonas sp. SWIR-19]|uniref:SAF domain-containing protein n=1 Tax=Sulfurimonas sp. SWIR-19 TaxID=2878390 RepID=UPI001CF45E43|nr:SAF domain-containing protein [Sulfurimonas sp. SWIR-19]UCM99936.1 SAF domain-containing protein [Sulfurimonas sp. SWIR-19]
MKNRKTRIIMGIMVGLVLFSSSVALLLYLKQEKMKEDKGTKVEVYVAAKKIHKGDVLNADSLKKATLSKNYITFNPLTDAEIIGRYANVDIYKGEPVRPEKIVAIPPKTKQEVETKKKKEKQVQPQKTEAPQQVTKDTLSVALSLFRNQDTSLRSGDFVDIACAIPSTNKKTPDLFYTKYVALHVKIDSFVTNGNRQTKLLSYNEKQMVVKADSVILQMAPKEIKNFLAYYYKTQALNSKRVYNLHNYGGQLWMIKTPKEIDAKLQKQKERLLVDRKVFKKQRKKHVQRVKISYEN